jgi:hypothetical protein
MAHYAFLDKNNVVTEVITGIDENELIEGLDPEIWYGNFRGQVCKRTSYNTFANTHPNNNPFRYNYAGIGYTFDSNMGEHGAFIPPQPFPSWTLDENAQWQPPVPYPDDENLYIWNETDNSWDIVENK